MFVFNENLGRTYFFQEESLISRYQKKRSTVLRYFGMIFGLNENSYPRPQVRPGHFSLKSPVVSSNWNENDHLESNAIPVQYYCV